MNKKFELGITSFAEVMPNPKNGEKLSYDQRIQQSIEEIVLADKLGLDFFGIGEHHRDDFAASAPHMILAGAALLTKQIKLGSSVTVLSSEDPVRVYQNFATLNALSNGRAEIMAGRGSFIESFPLFGYDLADYNQLYAEKLDLLINIRDNEFVTFNGQTRESLNNIGIYPRTSKPLKISVAVGGTPESVIRAAKYGLPLVLAIIGGNPLYFKRLVDLYKSEYLKAGHDPSLIDISVHSHGLINEDHNQAIEDMYPSLSYAMSKIGQERGWPPYTRAQFEHALSIDGALYVGNPEYVAKKILYLRKNLGINRFTLHVPVGYMDHELVLKTIRLLATDVRKIIDDAISEENKNHR
jgi:probable LLM family oxidoreductase